MWEFTRDEKRPGKPILNAGLVTFVFVFAFVGGLVWNTAEWNLALNMVKFLLLLLVPLILGLVLIFMVTPGVSLMYAFSVAKRNWRGVLGCILLVAAALAIVFAADHIRLVYAADNIRVEILL